jgi:DNA-directed RNA polymerase specialized sigma24 family protein
VVRVRHFRPPPRYSPFHVGAWVGPPPPSPGASPPLILTKLKTAATSNEAMGIHRPFTGGCVRSPRQTRPFQFVRNAILMGDDVQEFLDNMGRKPVSGQMREDVRQQATLIAIQKIDEWLGSESLQEKYDLRQHVFAMTSWRLRDWRRVESRWPQQDPDDNPQVFMLLTNSEGFDVACDFFSKFELRQRLEDVVTDLEWVAIEATVIDDLSYKAAAKRVGISLKSLKKARERAVQKIREWHEWKNSQDGGGENEG